MIRLLIVDDHSVVRRGLETLLGTFADIEIVGTAADGIEAVQLAAERHPDIILMDLSMPNLDGFEATRQILAANPKIRIVALTSFSEQRKVFDAISSGAIGYLLKDSTPAELVDGVRAAFAGESPLDPKAARVLIEGQRNPVVVPTLSPREWEVARVLSEGLTNKGIGKKLGISERTVKAHLTAIFSKLEVSDRTQAAIWVRDNPPNG
ncbi:MAG: response regulator transcription factor [Actinobacteria bacterium]|nr:response regulator transcription factor [Actinomycetota bacterium]